MLKIHSKQIICFILTFLLLSINIPVFAKTVVIVNATSVSLNKTTDTLKVGGTDTLKATIAPSNATNKKINWTSSDATHATVDGTGKVKGVAVGSATITATTVDGAFTATCDVNVYAVVSKVSLNKTSDTLVMGGGTDTLIATITPDNAKTKDVTWTSSKSSIASVDATGIITAVAAGTATINVTTVDGKKTATCKVTVTAPVSTITLNITTDTLKVGSTDTLKATIAPSNATNKKINWTSSDDTKVSVSTTGKIKGVSAGTATISATTVDGTLTTTCDVTVYAPVTSVSLDKTTDTLLVGGSDALIASIAPDYAANKAVTWKSSNNNVASVDTTGVITGVKKGTATITVSTVDGKKTATCKVTVKTALNDSETSVSLNKVTDALALGDTDTLIASVNATDKAVTWSSSDKTVATVSDTGLVTPVKLGSVTITVTTVSGSKTDTCIVTVIPITNNTTANNVTTLGLVGTQTSSSTPSVATVSITGGKIVITSVGTGTATITVTNASKNTATIAVTVAANGAISIGSITKYAAVTNNAITNDVATLGLVGITATSDTPGVAKVRIMDSKIAITSVGAGTAVITVTDASAHTATIAVTVVANGAISIETITKYAASAPTFAATTDSSTANTTGTLGLIGTGTPTSSASGVATATITGGNIVITSVSTGTATITVKDSSFNAATIAVTVSATGSISIGTITKYAASATATISDLVGKAGDSGATFTFSAATGASTVVLMQSTNGGAYSASTVASTLTASSTTATATGLTNGTAYSFELVITGGTKAGTSNIVILTPAAVVNPNNILDFAGTVAVNGTIDFTFSPMSGATAVDLVQQSAGTQGIWVRLVPANTLTPSSTHISVDSQGDTPVNYRLIGWDAKGDQVYASNAINMSGYMTLTPIKNLAATPGDGRVNLTFSASPGATSVVVEQSPDGGNYLPCTTTSTLNAASTSAIVTRLTNGTQVYLKVTVVGGTCAGESNVVRVTPVKAVIVPIKLAQVTGVFLSATGIVSWTAVPNAASYTVTVNGGNGSTITDISKTSTSQDMTSLVTTYGDYTVTVTAVGDEVYYYDGNASAQSNSESATFANNPIGGFAWSGDTAKWSDPGFAPEPSSYNVQLYKDSTAVGPVVNTTSTSVDFTSLITTNGSGTYTYKVTSQGDGKFILNNFTGVTGESKTV